ncbi:MAG: DNA-deoxyinosine glycosylase [Novosphingobium sp. 28-62-57]|uniref:DNA-deoxyinosine glycosylase n=1 Tax=unclassified Novosphingobium TaxID=2644732 RepID=UPI000BD325A2|nr:MULTISPECIES: DNA-deoxyinosine glycosylase [unclassified Novosphingobium]OYW50872.1 MAG: DNA-deoxyinosine glycosylase [Novosphingobium sp. 12-62-10]OYZ09990.1 MAG: DNA-deoxyinosine glycosylase [Novosphingobium sp. 28-62-57]OZA36326.1 MAG: DNA-deoxyinosine glycosylase [Novosphingobium sp. 17-62-9]
MTGRKASFAPVVDGHTRVLILGSLPGEASLAAARYYAHPRNQFWRLVGAVIAEPLVELEYPARLEMLRNNGIGLWDTIASATRPGSLDAAIRDVQANALETLVEALPMLRCIAFNGAKSAAIGMVQLAGVTGIELVRLPSSSPAHAALTFEAKLEQWMNLRKFLR